MPTIDLAHAEAPFILTLDLGSSSSRAMLFDARARSIDGLETRDVHPLHVESDGTAEDDAEESLRRTASIIDHVLKLAGDQARHIGAVAMDTYATNILGLDAAGQPITPIYTYADTRATEDALQLRKRFDEAAIQDRTGCLIRASYLPARFAWLQRTQPQRLTRVQRWMSLGEFIFERFFGRAVVSSSTVSWSGLLNRRAVQWDEAWFNALPISLDQFSPIVDASDPLIGLQPEWASRWPMLKDVKWFPAIGDGAAANIGSGCAAPDRLALTIGTSGALRVALDAPPNHIPFGLWCYRIDRHTSLLGGATTEGGNVYAWLRQTLNVAADDQFDRAIQALAPDAHGLTALPFIAGERSPGYAGDRARAAIVGLSINTPPTEIARALLEAVAYRFAIIVERIDDVSPPALRPAQVVASGGALLRAPAWLHIFADVLNRPVIASAESEATSRGTALIALRALGIIQSFDDLPASLGETYQPDPKHHAIYVKAIERQQQLYELLVMSNE
jgi:gluconokinase